jgi:hypothetical protein
LTENITPLDASTPNVIQANARTLQGAWLRFAALALVSFAAGVAVAATAVLGA